MTVPLRKVDRERELPSADHQSTHRAVFQRHSSTIPLQRPSVKRTQDAVCEASFWTLGAMATPTKQQHGGGEGGRQEAREVQGGKERLRRSQQAGCQSKTLTQMIQAWVCAVKLQHGGKVM